MAVWTFLILVIAMFENVKSGKMSEAAFEVPLSKSLGFSLRENFGKTLKDTRFGLDYLELHNEMLKASRESTGLDEDDDEIGTDLTRLKRIADRRRFARMQSPFGRRRARSQALRREKLNSQSLKSHREHSKHSSLEQSFLI